MRTDESLCAGAVSEYGPRAKFSYWALRPYSMQRAAETIQYAGRAFIACLRGLQETYDALGQAQEVADYQLIGVRCREALLAFIGVAQNLVPWAGPSEPPKKADLKAWSHQVCSIILVGDSHKKRRQLFKTLLKSAWEFANWLAHATSSHWHVPTLKG